MSIENYRHHFLSKKFDYEYKVRGKSKKNNLSDDFDKLFFNFLIIIQYNIPFQYNKHIEKSIKYEISQKMENMKIKKKEDIINNLCFDNEISLFTLFSLAKLYNVNLIYHNHTIYHCSISKSDQRVYIVNSNKDIYYIKQEKLETILETCVEISDLYKPYYSMSHYKLDNLIDIIDKLKIGLNSEVKYKKIDYYNLFIKHINKLLI
jgi:hypothetical protein